MAVEGAVTPGSSVRWGRVGTGEAQVLESKVNPLQRFYAAKNAEAPDPKAVQAQRNADNKALDTMLDVSPPKAWSIFDPQIYGRAQNIRAGVLKYKEGGGDLSNPAFKTTWANAVDDMEMAARYSEGLEEDFNYARNQAKGIQDKNDYYNWPDYIDDLFGNIIDDENGKRTPKNLYNIDRERFSDAGMNPDNFNKINIWKDALKAFPEMIDSHNQHWSTDEYTGNTRREIRSQLLTYEELEGGGRRVVTKNGLPVINMDIEDKYDPAKEILMDNEWVKRIVEDGREKGMSEADIWQTPLDLLEMTAKVSTEGGGKPRSDGGGSSDFSYEINDAVPRLHNVYDSKTGTTRQTPIDVAREYTFSGSKMDKENGLRVKTRQVWDIESGKKESGYVGDQEMVITSMQLIPWNYGGQDTTALAQDINAQMKEQNIVGVENINITPEILNGGEEAVRQHLASAAPAGTDVATLDANVEQIMKLVNDKGHAIYKPVDQMGDARFTDENIGFRWVAQGQMRGESGLMDKQVLVPWEDVRGKVNAATKTAKNPGFDINTRHMSEWHEQELIDFVKSRLTARNIPLTKAKVEEYIADLKATWAN